MAFEASDNIQLFKDDPDELKGAIRPLTSLFDVPTRWILTFAMLRGHLKYGLVLITWQHQEKCANMSLRN